MGVTDTDFESLENFESKNGALIGREIQKMRNDFKAAIDDIATALVQQQGINFDSYLDARRHFNTSKIQIAQSLQQGNAILIKGLEYLQENADQAHSYVSDMAARILKNRHASKKLQQIVERQIFGSEHALRRFTEAVNSYVDCGDYDKECCVIAVLMTLYPLNPQPYVCFGTMLWRRDGIVEAENFYSKIIDGLNNPVLDYFAADCFIKRGNKSKAKEVILRALATAENSPDMFGDTRQELLEFLRRC